MFKENYSWNYDYVRLSLDNGFLFENQKSEDFDKSKVCLVDIDRIISERDIATLDKFLPSITKFILDSEQAKLLDESFVKTFRLSQLAVDYLLFCKKYLDKTVSTQEEKLSKLEEENADLKLFVEDLKQHIEVLIHEKTVLNNFKCEDCNKVFSSPEYLESHKKRRHFASNNKQAEAENDKLHSEIKELKGRLNTAEKLLQENSPSVICHDSKLGELQQKFEELRLQVHAELKVLHTHQNFEEKYEKWVEKMAFSNIKSPVKQEVFLARRESTTQTEAESRSESESRQDSRRRFEEFGVALETKVSSSLQKIEQNMQCFWMKLHDLESKHIVSPSSPKAKPRKARTKFTMQENEENTLQKISKVPEVEKIQTHSPVRDHKSKPLIEHHEKTEISLSAPELPEEPINDTEISNSSPDSESDVSTESSRHHEPIIVVKKIELPVNQDTKTKPRPHTAKKVSIRHKKHFDKEFLHFFKSEVEKVLFKRLQDIGISPEWTGIPIRTFERALEIVRHQARLLKKTYPDCEQIAAKIEEQIGQQIRANTKPSTTPEKSKTLMSKTRIRASPTVDIKNRQLYETDTSESESEAKIPQTKPNLQNFSNPFGAVIEELKSVTAVRGSDTEPATNIANQQNKPEPKSVLKNFPSVGSLNKKKVLFKLEEEVLRKNEGETTSVASSVLDDDDADLKNAKQRDKANKDIEDLSDVDFDF